MVKCDKIVLEPHSLQECPLCGQHIRCGHCGNNCCNGGTGTLPDGSECGCADAYKVQGEFFKKLLQEREKG